MQRHQKLSKIEKNGMNDIIFFFCEILCLFVNLVPSASFCYRRKASKMRGDIRGTSKVQIPQIFSELEKFRSTVQACNLIKINFPSLPWTEKTELEQHLKIQLEQHLKIRKHLCELKTTRKYSLMPMLKNPNLASIDDRFQM